MKKQLLYLLAVTAVAAMVFVTGCQKEVSFEGSNDPAKGSLQADVTGDCLPKTVNGIYASGTALIPGTNTIAVQVNVTQTGSYVVTTDTVNGYFFRATGIFTTLGATTVTLRGNGTPFAQGINNFVVSFDGTSCDIAVTVLPAGAGAAVFVLTGGGTGTPPPSCSGATVVGTYTAGIPLNASNTVIINVNCTTAGSYNLTTAPAVNGMIFSGSGVLTPGPQTITLTGSGTPGIAGNSTIPITVGTTACSFTVTVGAGAGPATFTLVNGGVPANCASAVVSGTYTQGVPLVAATNYVDITVNVTVIGSYTITATGSGMTFTKTGTFATTGNQTVRLDGSGAPTASGAAVAVTFAAPFASCSFTVTVAPGAGPATFTLVNGGAPPNCASAVVSGTYTQGVALVAATNYVDITVNVTVIGSYTITATGGGMTFTKTGTFATTGSQTVRLVGSGTPTTAGANTITFAAPFASCSFTVTVAAPPSNDYFPRTTNSNWSYEYDDNADPTDSLLRKALSNTITAPAGGNAFTIFMGDDGTGFDSSGYYRKSGNDYYEWFNWANYLNGITAPAWAEYIMLKDNLAAGSPAWKTGATQVTTASGTIYLRFSYKILQKDVPITVTTSLGAITYQNVIVVEERIDGSADGISWVDLSTASNLNFYGKSYYARGIGLIMYEAFDASNALLFKQELRRSNVF